MLPAVRRVSRHIAPALAAPLFAFTCDLTSLAVAQAPGDFELDNEAWNGLSRLREIAGEADISLEVVLRVDLGTLRPDDALLLLAPREEPPAAALTEFLRAGGRVALADDFARGDSLLRAFRIVRGPPNRVDAPRLRGNDELLVATPSTEHPLTRGVVALVTNHPQIVAHPDLDPIFAFRSERGGAREAVVLAGAVGAGRLIAIADPSVLINNMLEFGGNRRFARNLLRYLHGEGEGRVIVVPPRGMIRGRFGEPGSDRPLHGLRAVLERLARAELPEDALRVAAAALAAILLIGAGGVLPRRSPYVNGAMLSPPPVPGGFVGRIAWFARRPANLGEPAMVYKAELETELHRALDLVGPVRIDGVIARMKALGMRQEDLQMARTLLTELALLQDEMERGTRGDALGERHLRRLVETGDALLEKVRRIAT